MLQYVVLVSLLLSGKSPVLFCAPVILCVRVVSVHKSMRAHTDAPCYCHTNTEGTHRLPNIAEIKRFYFKIHSVHLLWWTIFSQTYLEDQHSRSLIKLNTQFTVDNIKILCWYIVGCLNDSSGPSHHFPLVAHCTYWGYCHAYIQPLRLFSQWNREVGGASRM